jgi:hypothetical protein
MMEHNISPDVSFGEEQGKNTKFPIRRNCSLKKKSDLYNKSYDDFRQRFPQHIYILNLFDLHDSYFNAQYLTTDKKRRAKWQI